MVIVGTMEPKNPNIANAPEVTNKPAPQKAVPQAPVNPAKGDKVDTNKSRADASVIQPGQALSNDLGNADSKVVAPYHTS